MSQDELSRIYVWRREAHLALVGRVAGLEVQMLWVLSRLGHGTPPTPSSPPSLSTPTASPSPIRSALSRVMEKLGREALTQFGLWLAGKLAMWVLPWLVAWWTMGGPLLRFLERWVAVFLG
jgi:hypothetical protein